MADGYEVEIDIDLAELKLAHADDSDCTCKGTHRLTVSLDLENNELHADYECKAPMLTAEAVQRLHEQAHPKGTLYAENCFEASCREAVSEYS